MLIDGIFETLKEFAEIIKKKFKGIYQNSSVYEKKIKDLSFLKKHFYERRKSSNRKLK